MQARWLDRSNVKAHAPLSNHAQVRGGRPSSQRPKRLIGSGTIVRSAISVQDFMLVQNVVELQRSLACSNLHHVNESTR